MQIIYVLVFLSFIWIIIYQQRQLREKGKLIKNLSKWYDIAFSDALTGLKNQAAYSRKISELERIGMGGWMIIVFDINDFKSINDTYGHLEGDKVLKSFADILKCLFSSPLYNIYRIGGDEFAIIAINANETKTHELLTELTRTELNRLSFTTAKGYAISVEGEPFDAVFKRADDMLYQNKKHKPKRLKKI